MPEKKKKKINIFKVTFFIGIIVFLFYFILDISGVFIKPELLLFDMKMRARSEVEESEKIVTIDIDDNALDQLGRWPWNLNIFAELIKMFDLYDVKAAAFVDLFFDQKADITFNVPESAEELKLNLKELVYTSENIDNILDYITDYNEILYQTITDYENIFITNTFNIPETDISEDEFQELERFYQSILLPEKINNIKKMDRFVISHEPIDGLLSAVDIIPPVGELSEVVKGVGFNRIFLDIDGKLRRYPLALNYNDKVYPSIVLAMVAHYYECPYDKINIVPGRYIELKEHNESKFDFDETIKIPVDENGFMVINWTGEYIETHAHYPFYFIALNHSYFIGKNVLKKYDVSTADVNEIYFDLMHTLNESGMLNENQIGQYAGTIIISFYMEILMMNGFTYEEFFEYYGQPMFGMTNDPDWRLLWDQLYFNNILLDEHYILNEKVQTEDNDKDPLPKRPDFYEVLNLIQHPEFTGDTDDFRHYYNNTMFFIEKDKIEDIRPLIHPPPLNIVIKNETVSSTLLDLKDKIVFLGLTATGLNAFNPSPYTERYMMHGLTPNVFNTIITRNYIISLNEYLNYLIMLIFALMPVIILLKFDIKYSASLSFIVILVYPYISWQSFINNNYVIPVFAPMLTYLTAGFIAVVYKHIQEKKEQKVISGMFSTMVSPEVLNMLIGDPDKFKLAGEKREATLFSSDVSGFTTISEGVTARELADILNVYLTPMSNIIMSYEGYCDKYEGDAIKSSFGVPIPDKNHAWKACYSALLQQEELKVIQRMILIKYGVEISARMGVNTGLVSAGNMGSEKKMQYTVMGEAVSLAEELEPINKLFESWIAIGPTTFQNAGDTIETRLLNYLIMGEGHKLPVYELMAWKKEPFLNHWLGKPIPKLIIDGYLKMTPEKILSYYHYYNNAKFSSNMLQYMLDFFENIKDECLKYIKTNDIFFVNEIKTGVSELENEMKNYEFHIKDEMSDSVLQESNELMQKSENSEGWEKIIFQMKSRIKKLLIENELLENKINKSVFDKFLNRIDILDKRVECINKRIRFPKENDSIGKTLSQNLVELLLKNNTEVNTNEIEKILTSLNGNIMSKKESFINYIKENSDDYHRLISEYCCFTEEQNQVRKLFYDARIEYLNRNWDNAISIFNKALEIIPTDGPSIMYIKRIENYKNNPPDENWKGEWVGEV